jgi:hypothetical protein
MKMSVFWDLRRVIWQKLTDFSDAVTAIIREMMEAVCTSETSVSFYQARRRNILQESHFHFNICLSLFNVVHSNVIKLGSEIIFSER